MPTLMIGDVPAFGHRDHRPGGKRQGSTDDGRQHENALVGAIGNDHFLEHEFEQIGKGLQHAQGPHDIGAAAQLDRGPDLAVRIDQERDDDQQGDQQGHALQRDQSDESNHLIHALLRRLQVAAVLHGRTFRHGARGPGDGVGQVEILDRRDRRPPTKSCPRRGRVPKVRPHRRGKADRGRPDAGRWRTWPGAVLPGCSTLASRQALPTGRAESPSLPRPRRAGNAARRGHLGAAFGVHIGHRLLGIGGRRQDHIGAVGAGIAMGSHVDDEG